ncbi:hypothetical protein DID78_06710 [Candidatus Marinamargulisbacteria bacterium SCGC AG-343-D04]|nr:hypothetical protein DID78_06710 [Candidatus Marinamargulisbacteria bacterium SCGC AG-343-D04]
MKKQWRSIDDLTGDKKLDTFKSREFQEGATELIDPVSRRSFLKYLGGTAALAGLTGCSIRKPYYKIKPYSKKVEHVVPGKPIYFASSMQINNDVSGILIETHEGRPTKIEGNPAYPDASGSSTVLQQASVLNLYDPDRLQGPLKATKDVSIQEFEDWMLEKRRFFKENKGEGLAVLVENNLSPAFHQELKKVQAKYPEATIYRYEPVNSDPQVQGLHALTQQYVVPEYDFKKSNVVLSFGEDFLGNVLNQNKYNREFSLRRDPDSQDYSLNRLYTFEERLSITGAKSDHRFLLNRSEQQQVLLRLIYFITRKLNFSLERYLNYRFTDVSIEGVSDHDIQVIADDLLANRGKSLVLVSEQFNEEFHQLCFLINAILGNNFKTIHYNSTHFSNFSYSQKSSKDSLRSLISELNNNRVDTVFIIGGNPGYTAPSMSGFKEALVKARDRVHLTFSANETSLLCNWVLPRAHFLESWGDLKSCSGVVSICQPVIKKMVKGYSDLELVHLMSVSYSSDYSILRKQWASISETKWDQTLHNGFMFKDGRSRVYPEFQSMIDLSDVDFEAKGLSVIFYPDYKVYDGRYSNNSWLQELPDPISKLTWDNAAYMSAKTAKRLSLKSGDVVSIQVPDSEGTVSIPVFVSPGHAHTVISIPLGYGKDTSNKVEMGAGVSAYALMSEASDFKVENVTLVKTGDTHEFATTQDHGHMEGRPHVRSASVDEYNKHPHFAKGQEEVPHDKSLWKDHDYSTGNQWGMIIDLGKCTSCNACITSCQAENNIPVVGKEEVLNGREMHWMRVDRYYEGDEDNPDVHTQPLTCLHCENAPCEQVCPVAATVHDDEGLNVMVYNRCVGTRYCSDNCPAKVRRFNFFDYHQRDPHSQKKKRFHLFDYMKEPNESYKKQFNPDVTVRMRGIMEKCTYCVQRIKAADQIANNENRDIRDGEVVTACQQACPANAIVMGNILDENSEIYRLRKRDRHYSILEQLLLKARTTYLAAVYNPNPRLVKTKKEASYDKHH